MLRPVKTYNSAYLSAYGDLGGLLSLLNNIPKIVLSFSINSGGVLI